eukprot:g8195.t1
MVAVRDGVVPWVEKYRPDNLDKIHGHEEILNTLQRFMRNNQLPNLLFHGPAGTGKTTTAVAICKQIFGAAEYKMSTLELNASDDRGIGVIRNEVKNFAQTTSFGSFTFDRVATSSSSSSSTTADIYAKIRKQFKVVILDEADSMTSAAQFALRRMIEQYSGNVRFMIICNFAHKIIPALVSRCTSFRFAVLPEEHTIACVKKVAEHEQLEVDLATMQALQKCSNGDLRKVLNLLQSLTILERAKVTAGDADGAAPAAGSAGTSIAGPRESRSTVGSSCHSPPRVRISEADIYRSLGQCTPGELDSVVQQLFTSTDVGSLADLLLKQRGNFHSMLKGLHERMIKVPFQTIEQREKVVAALANIERRFCLGSFKEDYEAAYLVNEVLMLRSKWVLGS